VSTDQLRINAQGLTAALHEGANVAVFQDGESVRCVIYHPAGVEAQGDGTSFSTALSCALDHLGRLWAEAS